MTTRGDNEESKDLHKLRVELHQVRAEIGDLRAHLIERQPLAERLALSVLEQRLKVILAAARSHDANAFERIEAEAEDGLKTIAEVRTPAVQ